MSELLLSLLILEIMIKRSFRRLDNSTQPLLITSSFFFFFSFFSNSRGKKVLVIGVG